MWGKMTTPGVQNNFKPDLKKIYSDSYSTDYFLQHYRNQRKVLSDFKQTYVEIIVMKLTIKWHNFSNTNNNTNTHNKHKRMQCTRK